MKEKKEETQEFDIDVSTEQEQFTEIKSENVPEINEEPRQIKRKKKTSEEDDYSGPISCLRNERIIVRYIPKTGGIWGNNPRHILSGGMAEGAIKTFVVPRLTSGQFVNVLTDKEKTYLEDIMGLEYNALSVYKKVNNYWDDSNDTSVCRVRLTKGDNYFKLSDPEDYIRYKILLANKDYIAPSMQMLQDAPKATYQFVIIESNEESKTAKLNMSNTMKCYKEFGKVEDDIDVLKLIVETLDGRPVSKTARIEFLQTKANELIQADSKLFLKVITDPLLSTKVLINKAVEAGVIYKRGDFYYTREGNNPLCESNEDPTFNIAAKYLNMPRHQTIKFSIEAKLK